MLWWLILVAWVGLIIYSHIRDPDPQCTFGELFAFMYAIILIVASISYTANVVNFETSMRVNKNKLSAATEEYKNNVAVLEKTAIEFAESDGDCSLILSHIELADKSLEPYLINAIVAKREIIDAKAQIAMNRANLKAYQNHWMIIPALTFGPKER